MTLIGLTKEKFDNVDTYTAVVAAVKSTLYNSEKPDVEYEVSDLKAGATKKVEREIDDSDVRRRRRLQYVDDSTSDDGLSISFAVKPVVNDETDASVVVEMPTEEDIDATLTTEVNTGTFTTNLQQYGMSTGNSDLADVEALDVRVYSNNGPQITPAGVQSKEDEDPIILIAVFCGIAGAVILYQAYLKYFAEKRQLDNENDEICKPPVNNPIGDRAGLPTHDKL
jgi:hypothetical protein